MRRLVFFLVVLFSGCLSNNVLMSSSQADNNVYKLHQIHLGMTQEQVYQIMRYPSSEDQITTEDGCYDIWFYVTKAAILDQSEYVPRNLTPLIFKDGIFVGMGYDFYESLNRKVNAPVAPEQKKTKEPEDINLEKQLAPQTPPATPKKPVKKTKPISMSSKPKKAETPPSKEDDSSNKLDEEDREMLEQGQEENFNDW